MEKLTGSIFDSETPTVIKVSRIAGAAVLTACAAMFYMVLAL
jgi:hypothetical protein